MRFRLRTVFLALTLSAIVFSWLATSYRRNKRAFELEHSVATQGGFAWDQDSTGEPPWLEVERSTSNPFGDPFRKRLLGVEFGTTTGSPLKRQRLALRDEALIELAPQINEQDIRWIGLQGAQLSPEGFKTLSSLKSLRGIDLSNSTITDNDLECIARMPNLRILALNDTQVSDTGLAFLYANECIEELQLCNTKTTKQGVKDLRDQIPSLQKIDWIPSPPVSSKK